jgi:hypothetical protein
VVVATSARTIELQPDAYDLVVREAARRGLEPEALVGEIVRAGLGERSTGDPRRRSRRVRGVSGRAAADRRGRPGSTGSPTAPPSWRQHSRLQRSNAYHAAYIASAQTLSAGLWTLGGPPPRNAAGAGFPVRLLA